MPEVRVAKAVHGGGRALPVDPEYVRDMAREFKATYSTEELVELYGRFVDGGGRFDTLMRRVIWRAISKTCGDGLRIETGVGMKHAESFEIGSHVFIGTNTFVQGRFDGRLVVGDRTWIGPGSYLDARDLVLEEHVGWGPGAKVLGAKHTGVPINVPINSTDLELKPVVVGAWSNIGTNAVIMPGVRIGKGAMVGAGAVVTGDVPAFAKVAGVPAKVIGWRTDAAECET